MNKIHLGGEFIIMQRLESGTDRGNAVAKRSDQGRHGWAPVLAQNSETSKA